jgi:hypothetical protein
MRPADDDAQRRNKLAQEMSDMMGEGNTESMLSVEMGLRTFIIEGANLLCFLVFSKATLQ